MNVRPEWFEYAIFDDECEITGIREDAPQSAKDAYKAYIEKKERYMSEGKPQPK